MVFKNQSYSEEPVQIYSQKQLDDLINDKGHINQSIIINDISIRELRGIKKIYGDLGVYSNSLEDFGELNYIKGDFWISSRSGERLKSLGKIERVGGKVDLKGTNIIDLGCLWRVGGRLNLRDTKVTDLSNLVYVKELFLPKKLREIDINHIETKKVRYWKDTQVKTSNYEIFENVGGNNLRYRIIFENNPLIEFHTSTDVSFNGSSWKDFDTGKGFSVGILKFEIPKTQSDRFYISPDQLEKQNNFYNHYKSQVLQNSKFLDDFNPKSNEISNFRNRLIYDLINEYGKGIIGFDFLLDKLIYFERVFRKCDVIKFEFLPIFNKLNLNHKLEKLIDKSSIKHLSYSQLHDMEVKLKKRFFTGEKVVCQINVLNNYIQKNISEYIEFIDNILQNIYDENYSLFKSLFSVDKTVDEINSEFPKKFRYSFYDYDSQNKLERLRKEGFSYLKKNRNDEVIQRYIKGIETFKNLINSKLNEKINFEELDYQLNKIWNGGNLWLSYNQNPLSYCFDNPSGNDLCYFVNNIIYRIFLFMTIGLQNEFRISKGLPKIGEGWISETDLYYSIKNEFKNIEIIHHGKPDWLGRQHVDIWIPKYNIGIEYQGLQHDVPIDFFGGEEGFKKNKERDLRKKKLFLKNNSILIEVREGYDKIELFNLIKEHIKKT